MYCSISDMKAVLPDNVTIGDINIGTPSPGQTATKRDKMTTEQAIKFIKMGMQELDARLTSFYVVPLRLIKTYETELLNDVSAGSNVKVRVWNTSAFSKGDILRIQGPDTMESVTVYDVTDATTLTIQTISGAYYLDSGKVSIIKVPDPVPIITARLAASYAWDELFSADQAPNISNYGKEQRHLADNAIDSILEGSVNLFGQEHTGRRFLRGTLLDAYGSPTASQAQFQFGREKTA
jgi:hypothetical protein